SICLGRDGYLPRGRKFADLREVAPGVSRGRSSRRGDLGFRRGVSLGRRGDFGGRQEPVARRPLAQRSFRANASRRCVPTRSAFAMIVSVVGTPPELGMKLPSTT